MCRGIHGLGAVALLAVAAGGARAQDPGTPPPTPPDNPPASPTPYVPPAPAPYIPPSPTPYQPNPSPTPEPKGKPTAAAKKPTKKKTTIAAPIEYRTGYDSLSRSRTGSTNEFLGLKRSARNKTFIPTAMDHALEWSRVSPTTKSAWDRKGGWAEKDKWNAPSTWNGAGLDQVTTSLTSTRSPGLSYSERHPLAATYGTSKSTRKK